MRESNISSGYYRLCNPQNFHSFSELLNFSCSYSPLPSLSYILGVLGGLFGLGFFFVFLRQDHLVAPAGLEHAM